MKDRLIELLGKADEATEILTGDFPSYEKELQAFYSSIADYLLDNGVIVLPCAVGDEVYIPNERFPAEIDEIRITPSGIFAEYVQYDRSYELTELWDGGSFCIEDIGKEVFFTKEEAEAKLKELEE